MLCAYLGYGKFESTSFTDANLTGVSFAKAWLRDTNFTRSNLTEVEFGVLPDINPNGWTTCLELSRNGQKLAVAVGIEVAIYEKDPAGMFFKEVRRLRGHEYNVECVSFSSDGKKILTSGRDKNLLFWDVETGEALQEFVGHRGSQKRCSFSQEGSKIVASSSDQSVRVYDATTGKEIFKVWEAPPVRLICEFSPDGKQILYLDESDPGAHIRDARTGRYLKNHKFLGEKQYSRHNIDAAKYIEDGRQIAACKLSEGKVLYKVGSESLSCNFMLSYIKFSFSFI